MSLDGRVLIVEDDASQREMLVGFLRDLGVETEEAEDGRQALDLLHSQLIDLVVTDLRMPRMEGSELLREIKDLNPEIGVVLVTAFGTVQGAVEALKAGACDYLLKPLDLDEVEHVLRRCLEERQLRRENRELKQRLGEIESLPGFVTTGGSMAETLSAWLGLLLPTSPCFSWVRVVQARSFWLVPSTEPVQEPRDRSSPSTPRHSPPLSWRASSSDTREGPSPEPSERESADSRAPMVALCSWMRSVTYHSKSRSSC